MDVVKFLLEKGANKSLKNARGKTALDIATENDFIEYTQVLK
jgi:ankyrin repeat protein